MVALGDVFLCVLVPTSHFATRDVWMAIVTANTGVIATNYLELAPRSGLPTMAINVRAETLTQFKGQG
jgi:hypothetical protein